MNGWLLAQETAEQAGDVTLSWPEYAGGILAALGILGLVWRGWRRLRRGTLDPLVRLAERADCLGQMTADWAGEPARPGFPGRPGVPQRLELMEGRLAMVEAELSPNHGHSVKDRVDQIARRYGLE